MASPLVLINNSNTPAEAIQTWMSAGNLYPHSSCCRKVPYLCGIIIPPSSMFCFNSFRGLSTVQALFWNYLWVPLQLYKLFCHLRSHQFSKRPRKRRISSNYSGLHWSFVSFSLFSTSISKKMPLHQAFVAFCERLYLRPGICGKYFLSFSQENLWPEKTEIAKCLLFYFWVELTKTPIFQKCRVIKWLFLMILSLKDWKLNT